jgi:hypothetical protein
MDEQLAQNQTIEALRHQVESSNNSACEAQALLRSSQDQQLQHSRMLPPTTYPSGTSGIISNTPFMPPLSTPSTGLRTLELHSPGYYQVGSPADQGYSEQMRAMYGREEVDPPTQDPPTLGLSSRGSGSQASHNIGWQSRPGQSVPAFPGSRIVPTCRIDSRDTSYRRILKFGTRKVPKLTKTTLVNTEVHHLI